MKNNDFVTKTPAIPSITVDAFRNDPSLKMK
jgi:hypothetical protein